DDKLNVSGFRLASGNETGKATIEGGAEIDGDSKSVSLKWNAVDLTQFGFPGTTEGTTELRWRAADANDVSGEASVSVRSRRYGHAAANVAVRNGRAIIDARATAFDTTLRANVTTGLDQTLTGTFNAVNNRYGEARLAGTIRGTFSSPLVTA